MNGLTRRQLLAGTAGLVFVLPAVATTSCPKAAAPQPKGRIRLASGRSIAFNEYGNPAGSKVVIYHHGHPGCRLECEVLLPALPDHPDLRLLSFDRPGMGWSDPDKGKSFCSWAKDLTACLDALGVNRFGLIGVSAGTPFALAAALELRDRVTAIAIASGLCDFSTGHYGAISTREIGLVRVAPAAVRAVLNSFARQVGRNPRALYRMLDTFETRDEKRFFQEDPAALELAAADVLEALRQGADGVVSDLDLTARPWGLSLGEVTAPTTLFHGAADRLATPVMAEANGRRIPNAVVRIFPGEGHISTVRTQATAILAAASA
ncbi:alpha/beta fold hydrolase [Fimbriiglobus ruber]|uniref:Hydrolase, alpha/beta hydrolase fold family n=1 Tax=Fimbriiglobus ruber TaxID=1908690 RepID=A0A225DR96_9BACT|nr:alpha/beta fold hydrolase [Fimbriiglobus ruber]OWK38657.1 Hydrolase, alpha/beta hydrolase fold family [Fimbriiglobus ruber]